MSMKSSSAGMFYYPSKPCIVTITRILVREFLGWPWKLRKDLESQGKVRKFEINCYGRQTSENLCILFKRGKDYILMK